MTQKNPPSIFNDVIGPVMRGPSSSHTAASVRIGRMVRAMLGEEPDKVLFEFDPNGALATTYGTQGSAMGLAAGLLGWEITHPKMFLSLEKAKTSGLQLDFAITDIAADHPSTYQITAIGQSGKVLTCTAISTGGGMVEFINLNDFEVSLKGDFYETLIVIDKEVEDVISSLKPMQDSILSKSDVYFSGLKNKTLVDIKSATTINSEVNKLLSKFEFTTIVHIPPVLPILSQRDYKLPFRTFEEMMAYAANNTLPLSELALEYESCRAGISKKEVLERMDELVEITRNAIRTGLSGTHYEDRILGQQSHLMEKADNDQKVIDSPTNRIIAYTSALMEVKSAMGVIIAAPTAGACGVLGGAVFGATDKLETDSRLLTKAFLAAGLIGIFIADQYTFAAEEGGCQVECGAGSGMAAAALVEMMGGDHKQAVSAASMAMQNLIGLICDPVADRVEVPCLGKNILGATNALNAANMSIAGFDQVIPLDQVIDTVKRVGAEMPASVCCTGLSGLSTTACSKRIFNKMKRQEENENIT